MRLPELQDNNVKAKELQVSKNLPGGWEDVEEILHYQRLSYVPKIIFSKLINRHYDDPLVDYFKISKTYEIITRNYF